MTNLLDTCASCGGATDDPRCTDYIITLSNGRTERERWCATCAYPLPHNADPSIIRVEAAPTRTRANCLERGHHAWTWADDTTDRQVCDDCGAERLADAARICRDHDHKLPCPCCGGF